MLGTVCKSCLTKSVYNKFFQAKRRMKAKERQWEVESKREKRFEAREVPGRDASLARRRMPYSGTCPFLTGAQMETANQLHKYPSSQEVAAGCPLRAARKGSWVGPIVAPGQSWWIKINNLN